MDADKSAKALDFTQLAQVPVSFEVYVTPWSADSKELGQRFCWFYPAHIEYAKVTLAPNPYKDVCIGVWFEFVYIPLLPACSLQFHSVVHGSGPGPFWPAPSLRVQKLQRSASLRITLKEQAGTLISPEAIHAMHTDPSLSLSLRSVSPPSQPQPTDVPSGMNANERAWYDFCRGTFWSIHFRISHLASMDNH